MISGEYMVVEMSGQRNVAPTIIKRKKIVAAAGHHGGAWKVAYADFVTAMMAFFMMMWLLNATTEKQKQGLADYFSPNIPLSSQSAGGSDLLSGDSLNAEDDLARSGIGATNENPTEDRMARGEIGEKGRGADRATNEAFEEIEQALQRRTGESAVTDDILKHIVTRVTDEGLIVNIFDLENAPLFIRDTDRPTRLLRTLTEIVARVSADTEHDIAISGHVRANPIVRAEDPVWPLSSNRADRMRTLLKAEGFPAVRVRRVTGHADRSPWQRDTLDVRNNRVQIIYLRE